MNSDSIILPKPTAQEVIQDITPFVLDEALEEQIQAEIEARIAVSEQIFNCVMATPPNKNKLLDLIENDPETISTIIAMLGLPQEGFYRLVTILRIQDNSFKNSEWKLDRIRKEMTKKRDFGEQVLNMLFYGKDDENLREKVPSFLLTSLDIRKLQLHPDAVIDTFIRRGIKGRYDAKKGKPVEDVVEEVLKRVMVEYLSGEIDVIGLGRDFDFVIPNQQNPHVFIEVGVFATTARELSEKGVVEKALYQEMKQNYPDAVMVRILDGIGWIARGGNALSNVIEAADYILTQVHIDEMLEAIIRHHVPRKFFFTKDTQSL